ncbi:class I SAM-dependent methyltransferase [Amycolatopsis rubida]|uniref:Class I SAM-dependent methyltransferase n=1 Tax=Amycolatopsis rubida TaxID=112413 RepID=A0A1I5NVH7_9PSEU|nr:MULTISPECIES: class I SAM-dependent methyltransferase [Amycolatopsis]MYW96930.1 methyltransferase domain-containing protein [Amycolatopsis rubida]NEC61915.1 class I SAM-dependent methyltransferase [Amycolatopsis rubida]OAP21554.1 Trans-aconitate 2-methyltransferase [Amycolatopsis sp. M39]SFP25819.1 Methyltransferase domain-containing protein [Amycolatopsis rubida]
MEWLTDTRTSYDAVAEDYATFVRDALGEQPYLLAALRLFAEQVADGPVADVGCGPGQITAHLNSLGIAAYGIDLSPGMIAVARRDYPTLRFEVGSLTDPLPTAALAGIVAWQSVIHLPDDLLPAVLANFRQALRPDGVLHLLFQVGDETRLKTEGYGGHPMQVQVHRRPRERMTTWLRDAGFAVEAELLLNPETPAPQALLTARSRRQ